MGRRREGEGDEEKQGEHCWAGTHGANGRGRGAAVRLPSLFLSFRRWLGVGGLQVDGNGVAIDNINRFI